MAISLYDAAVANYLQTLEAVGGFLEKGLAHFRANQVDLDQVVPAENASQPRRLAEQWRLVQHA